MKIENIKFKAKRLYNGECVEGYHRKVRKVTKTKGVFPTDNSLEKLVYLAYRNS